MLMLLFWFGLLYVGLPAAWVISPWGREFRRGFVRGYNKEVRR